MLGFDPVQANDPNQLCYHTNFTFSAKTAYHIVNHSHVVITINYDTLQLPPDYGTGALTESDGIATKKIDETITTAMNN